LGGCDVFSTCRSKSFIASLYFHFVTVSTKTNIELFLPLNSGSKIGRMRHHTCFIIFNTVALHNDCLIQQALPNNKTAVNT
jgi:hypothetical protein